MSPRLLLVDARHAAGYGQLLVLTISFALGTWWALLATAMWVILSGSGWTGLRAAFTGGAYWYLAGCFILTLYLCAPLSPAVRLLSLLRALRRRAPHAARSGETQAA